MEIILGSRYSVRFTSSGVTYEREATFRRIIFNRNDDAYFFCFSTDDKFNDLVLRVDDNLRLRPLK